MKRLQPTTQYKKDYKRFKNDPKKVEALKNVLRKLKNEIPIPAKYQTHPLHGHYDGCMECHIQGDFLLIWFDPASDIIELIRLGSHAELFK
jgi:mRNA interferase YafQ